MTSGSLVKKLAFITGAGSGIGRAACNVLANEGVSIIAADLNLKSAEETVNNISKTTNHLPVKVDVGNESTIKWALTQALDHFREPPAIIVNSAGITRDNFLLQLSSDDFDEVIKINLKGTFLVTKIFANAIVEHKIQNASIVNIASIVDKYGYIRQSNYTASKAGVEALTKTSAKELGKFGIRVNCVLPGMIKTSLTKDVPNKVIDKLLKNIPLGRLGQPEGCFFN